MEHYKGANNIPNMHSIINRVERIRGSLEEAEETESTWDENTVSLGCKMCTVPSTMRTREKNRRINK